MHVRLGSRIWTVACLAALTLTACAEDDEGSGENMAGDGDGANGYCAETEDWDAGYAQLEQDVLDIVNQRRSEGANCGSRGSFDPAPPLSMNAKLRCAARVHSKDMVDRGYFDHESPNGEGPGERVDRVEYSWRTWGENIAAGSSDAAGTMQQWMNSDGHCANIMKPDYTELGVGYHPGGDYGHVWTQVFGAPR